MTQTKSLILLTGAALGLSGSAIARQNAAWSTASADDVRAVVAEMLSDAETRSSLAASGATAGYDKGFFLGSADGNFKLQVGGLVQFRYVIDYRSNPPAGADDFIPGFQTARTRLNFSGHVFDPNLFYKIEGQFGKDGGPFGGGAMGLLDAFVGYKWDNGFSARWGQFQFPLLRETLVSPAYNLAVESSFVNAVFGQDYSQGIEGTWESDNFRFKGGFSDGIGSRNTDLNSGAPAFAQVGPADWALTGRVEWLIAGQWQQFKDFTSPRGSEFAGMLGLAGHYEGSPDFPTAPRNHNLVYTADLSIEGDGWNLFGSFVGANQDSGPTGAPNFDDYGWVVQGGIYLSDEFELFGRYDGILPDSSRESGPAGVPGDSSGNNYASFVTAGFNYYFHGHGAKFTFDTIYAIDGVNDNAFLNPTPPPPAGVGSVVPPFQAVGTQQGFFGPDGGNSEWIFRMQFQLMF